MSKKSLLAVGIVTALTLALVACGPPAEPEEVQLSTELIQQYWAEGTAYQNLAISLFQEYPDLPLVNEILATAAQGPLQAKAVLVYAKSESPEALAALQGMTVGQLKARYREVFGEPTRSNNKAYLRKNPTKEQADG